MLGLIGAGVAKGKRGVRCVPAVTAKVREPMVLFYTFTPVTHNEPWPAREEAVAGVHVLLLRRDLLIRHLDVAKAIIVIVYHVVQETQLLVVPVRWARPDQQTVQVRLLAGLRLRLRFEGRLAVIADRGGRALPIEEGAHSQFGWAVALFYYE